MGQGTCSLYWTEVQESTLSPAVIPDCRLQNFLWSVFPKTLHWHSPDLLVLTPGRSFSCGIVLGTVSKCVGSVHTYRWPAVPRSVLLWPQSYSLLGLALGSVRRLLFSEKHEKCFSSLLIHHQHSFLIYAIFPGAISMKFLKALSVHY